jgi:type IV pilus assembly protein PilA
MFKKYLKNQKGLTLIELLAVVVILGIIAAIAVPAIGNVINNSKQDAALADAQQIIDAAKLYVASEGKDISGTLTIDDADADFNKYLDKASEFTSVKVTAAGDYSIVGHAEANKAAKARDANIDTTELSEAEIQSVLNK